MKSRNLMLIQSLNDPIVNLRDLESQAGKKKKLLSRATFQVV